MLPAVQHDSETTDPVGYILPIRRRQHGRPVVLVEPVVVPAPEASAIVARRFAYRLSHSDRVDSLGCAG